MFEKIKEKYNIIYIQTFYYFEGLWGKDRGIVPTNTGLALSMSAILWVLSSLLFLNFFFGVNWLFIFLNSLFTFSFIGFIIIFHTIAFERKERFRSIIKQYENKNIDDKSFRIHKRWSRIYLFGPLVFFMFIISYYIISRG